jgi:hypothetical protein
MKKMTKPARVAEGQDRSQFTELQQLPNVGPAVAADLRLLGIIEPKDLLGRDPYRMYEALCPKTKQRHDPCLLDVFLSVVRFMEGALAKPWWAYTEERKQQLLAHAVALATT